MFHDLAKRGITSCLIGGGLALLLFFPPYFLGVLVMASSIGAYEYAVLSKLKSKYDLVFFAGAVVVSQYFNLHYVVLSLAALFFFVRQLPNIESGFREVAQSFFGLIYVAVPLSMLMSLLLIDKWWVVYILVVTKSVDTFAYFGGRLFGKRKLAPLLSPAKTIEGAVIGLFSAMIVSGCFPLLPFKNALIMGGVIGVLAQIGDLSESLLKRSAGAKDSNRLPGLGGVLDMLDSLLFTIPVLYLYLFL